jgi:hypothetical protein
MVAVPNCGAPVGSEAGARPAFPMGAVRNFLSALALAATLSFWAK